MLVPTGRGKELEEQELPPDEYEKALEWMYDAQQESDLFMKPTDVPHYWRVMRQRAKAQGRKLEVHPHSHGGMNTLSRGCLAGIGFCFISHIGEVQGCGYFDECSGGPRPGPREERTPPHVLPQLPHEAPAPHPRHPGPGARDEAPARRPRLPAVRHRRRERQEPHLVDARLLPALHRQRDRRGRARWSSSASRPSCCSASPRTRTPPATGAYDHEGIVQMAIRAHQGRVPGPA